jgi:hypothetical protein
MSDTENTTTVEGVLSALKSLEAAELFKVIKSCVAEAEKKTKGGAAATTRAKKSGSMPKGAVPPQLKKPRAWVEFTLKHALENGWEAFTIHQNSKDKETGEKVEEVIEMPASVFHDGAHIYKDSVSTEHPSGKQLIHKDAMSLSKQRKENNHSTYAEFEAQYVAEEATEDEKSVATSTTSSKKRVVKKTVAEKEAEAAAKKAEKEAEKERKKQEKEAEKAAKAAEKEAEKERKKQEKEAEKATKKPTATSKTPVKAKAAPAAEEEKPAPTKAVKAAATPAKTVKKPAAKEEIPDDGMVHAWTYNGKKYLRNAAGETWATAADGGCGAWVGLYSSKTDKLDTTAPEPEFDE